ncbi:hypothetical protein CEE69_11840 [Rhodopirellula bahusiensis]|uniref:Uncharacterized protein n=1 Tax=Rhodopirellula bahusiensis TaxID=2014065 RepID=A0A2G1W7T3_9BACT|nr:hypothetical protein CEE69_11840 [Rhodopirellula bahusiensis]
MRTRAVAIPPEAALGASVEHQVEKQEFRHPVGYVGDVSHQVDREFLSIRASQAFANAMEISF